MTAQEAYFLGQGSLRRACRPRRRWVQLHLVERQRGDRERRRGDSRLTRSPPVNTRHLGRPQVLVVGVDMGCGAGGRRRHQVFVRRTVTPRALSSGAEELHRPSPSQGRHRICEPLGSSTDAGQPRFHADRALDRRRDHRDPRGHRDSPSSDVTKEKAILSQMRGTFKEPGHVPGSATARTT